MVLRTASELRISASHMREMASEGTDASLQNALRLVADEFEREAAGIDTSAQLVVLDNRLPGGFSSFNALRAPS